MYSLMTLRHPARLLVYLYIFIAAGAACFVRELMQDTRAYVGVGRGGSERPPAEVIAKRLEAVLWAQEDEKHTHVVCIYR